MGDDKESGAIPKHSVPKSDNTTSAPPPMGATGGSLDATGGTSAVDKHLMETKSGSLDTNLLIISMLEKLNIQNEQINRQSSIIENLVRHKEHETEIRTLHPTDNIEHYFKTFERQAQTCRWPKETWVSKLAPKLTGKALSAYSALDNTDLLDYDKFKTSILIRYDINTESYRQQFRNLKKGYNDSYKEFSIKLRELCVKWLKPNANTIEQIIDIFVSEQIVNFVPTDVRKWIYEHRPKDLKATVKLADDFTWAQKNFSIPPPIQSNNHFSQNRQDQRNNPPTQESYRVSSRYQERHKDSFPSESAHFLKPLKDITCFKCNMKGHYANKCRMINHPRPQEPNNWRQTQLQEFVHDVKYTKQPPPVLNVHYSQQPGLRLSPGSVKSQRTVGKQGSSEPHRSTVKENSFKRNQICAKCKGRGHGFSECTSVFTDLQSSNSKEPKFVNCLKTGTFVDALMVQIRKLITTLVKQMSLLDLQSNF